jgi:dsDNA-binding SOS-regulon protein
LDFQQNLITDLKSPITITEEGKKKKITKFEAFMKSVVAEALKGNKAMMKLLLDFLQKLPKYAFEEDEVAWVTTKKEVEAFEKVLEDARKAFPELCEPNSNQDQGNGSSSGKVDNQEQGNSSSSGEVGNQEQGNGSSSAGVDHQKQGNGSSSGGK